MKLLQRNFTEITNCSQIVDEYVRRPDVKRRNPDAIDTSELARIPAQIFVNPTL